MMLFYNFRFKIYVNIKVLNYLPGEGVIFESGSHVSVGSLIKTPHIHNSFMTRKNTIHTNHTQY